MRVSLASFSRIRAEDGTLALLINKGQLKKGKEVLLPVGGASMVTALEGEALMNALGITPEDFEKPPLQPTTPQELGEERYDPRHTTELRFRAPADKLGIVRREFTERFGPDSYTVYTENREELVEETGILKYADLVYCNVTFATIGEETAASDRAGGEETFRMASVFDVAFPRKVAAKLQRAAQRPGALRRLGRRLRGKRIEPMLYFVRPDEIEAGVTDSGIKIASIAKLLLV